MRRGFTLIELIVVIVIVLILVAIFGSALRGCGGNSRGRPVEQTGSGWGRSDMDRVNGR